MGVYIYTYVEIKVNNNWQLKKGPGYASSIFWQIENKALHHRWFYHEKCLSLHTLLGRKDSDTWEIELQNTFWTKDIKAPITKPKEFPKDISNEVIKEFKKYSQHHFYRDLSYVTLQELLHFDWYREINCRSLIPKSDYYKWDKISPADYYNINAFNKDDNVEITHWTEFEKNNGKVKEKGKQQLVIVEYKDYLNRRFDDFLDFHLPKLKVLDSNPDNVRLVYWFDG